DQVAFEAAHIGVDLGSRELGAATQMIDGFGRAVHAQQITSLDGVELGEETAVARGHGQCCGRVLRRASITWASAHEQVPAAQHLGAGSSSCASSAAAADGPAG